MPNRAAAAVAAQDSPVSKTTVRSGPRACLSVDVEEYFHAEVFAGRVSPGDRRNMPRRAAVFVERLAELLQRHESKATFFVLGQTVAYLTPLLRQLALQGHEIACHGDGHEHLARMTPETLREDLRAARGRIEDAVGVRPRGYRAPTFSITHATAWALDVVIEAGFEYDASIFPIHHDRYGVPGAPVQPFWAVAPSGAHILEFPPFTLDFGPLRVPVGGGGYLRLLPGAVLRRCVASRLRRDDPVMLYLHPWELDTNQPRLKTSWLSQRRHRLNLHTTAPKLRRLLTDFRFDTAWNVLARVRADRVLDTYVLAKHRRA